jgi:hypothetical protein
MLVVTGSSAFADDDTGEGSVDKIPHCSRSPLRIDDVAQSIAEKIEAEH